MSDKIYYLEPRIENYEFQRHAIAFIKFNKRGALCERFQIKQTTKSFWTGSIDFGWFDTVNRRFVKDSTVELFCDIKDGKAYWKSCITIKLKDGTIIVDRPQSEDDTLKEDVPSNYYRVRNKYLGLKEEDAKLTDWFKASDIRL